MHFVLCKPTEGVTCCFADDQFTVTSTHWILKYLALLHGVAYEDCM